MQSAEEPPKKERKLPYQTAVEPNLNTTRWTWPKSLTDQRFRSSRRPHLPIMQEPTKRRR